MRAGETLGKRIRAVKIEKIPYFLVLGDKEKEAKQVMVESRDKGQLGAERIEDLLQKLSVQNAEKR